MAIEHIPYERADAAISHAADQVASAVPGCHRNHFERLLNCERKGHLETDEDILAAYKAAFRSKPMPEVLKKGNPFPLQRKLDKERTPRNAKA